MILTNREKEVYNRLLTDMTLKEIADDLSITISTAATHRGNIFKKLKVSSRLQLVSNKDKIDINGKQENKKRIKDLAKELNISKSTLNIYLSRGDDFSFLKIYHGKILNWEMDFKFKIYNKIKEIRNGTFK